MGGPSFSSTVSSLNFIRWSGSILIWFDGALGLRLRKGAGLPVAALEAAVLARRRRRRRTHAAGVPEGHAVIDTEAGISAVDAVVPCARAPSFFWPPFMTGLHSVARRVIEGVARSNGCVGQKVSSIGSSRCARRAARSGCASLACGRRRRALRGCCPGLPLSRELAQALPATGRQRDHTATGNSRRPMMAYFLLKYLHILGSIVLIGTGASIAFSR